VIERIVMRRKIVAGLAGVAAVVAVVGLMPSGASAVGAPSVTNLAGSGVTDNAAVANCSVNPNDNEVEVFVVYKKSSDSWSSGPVHRADYAGELPTGNTTQSLAVPLPGAPVDGSTGAEKLHASTGYDYRCKVEVNDDGQSPYVDTSTKSFTTSADAISVTLLGSDGVVKTTVDTDGNAVEDPTGALSPTEIVLHCGINPDEGDVTKTWVVYKQSSQTWSDAIGGRDEDGSADIPADGIVMSQSSALLSGLTPGTTYDWRCKADSSAINTITSTTTGQFTTPAS
jgi:hypothetical protein